MWRSRRRRDRMVKEQPVADRIAVLRLYVSMLALATARFTEQNVTLLTPLTLLMTWRLVRRRRSLWRAARRWT